MQNETEQRHWDAAGERRWSEQPTCDGLQQPDRSDSVVRGERDREDDVQQARDAAAQDYRRDV